MVGEKRVSLLNYWPTRAEIDRCIKSEAESASDEVLLAVHQEFPLAYFKVGPDGRLMPDSRNVATEEDLLRYLLGSAPEGSLVVPITGASGVGKSHLIRILDARLRKLPEASRYLIIRIPKSASLRRVVELILEAEPLQGPSYDPIRAEFEKALEDIPLEKAVILFQAQLRIALEEHAATLRQQLSQDVTNEVIKSRLHFARGLPQFLGDSVTEGHFHKVVFPRIIHRSVEGISASNAEIDPTDSQFKPEDFDLPDSLPIEQASLPVRNFYQTTLCTREGRGKIIAADVLNSVVDQATRQLYKLHESLGGRTLGEVIGDIRRLLLAEDPNKELVILVEDFAALVGIQDTLAKILIQHGQTEGVQTLATIRSVIAVTDGYLAGRDTLATRAGREWVVESRFESEEETLRRAGLLVASYLNAARHGEAFLKDFYRRQKEVSKKSYEKLEVPVFSEDSGGQEGTLEAFGYISKIPIFPFTEAAIEYLARSTLTKGNVLVFTPRFVIKNVVRELLLTGRDSFENEHFPPPEIIARPLAADVEQWLESQGFPTEIGNRYRRLLAIWGNNPSTRSDIARIPKQVFDAFHLPVPRVDVAEKPPEKEKETPPPRGVEVTDQNAKQIQAYQNALEKWVQDKITLDQDTARAIRRTLAILVNQRIDWNAERCLKREIGADKFSIPNASGELNLAADAFKIAESTDDKGGQLRLDLLSLLRYGVVYQMNTTYPDADEDLARVSNLVDRLIPSALELLRNSVKKQTHSSLLLLAANSRLLGLSEKGRTPGALSLFLFGDVPQVEQLPDVAPEPFKEWRILQQAAFDVREQLKQFVLETAGCFQGTGKNTYGVDIVRLVEDYPVEGDSEASGDTPGISSELKAALAPMRQATVFGRFRQVLRGAQKIKDFVDRDLGEDFDKQAVINAMNDVVSTLKEMGAWRPDVIGATPTEYGKLSEAFRNAAVKEALSVLQAVVPTNEDDPKKSVPQHISKGAQLSLGALIVAEQFVALSKRIVKAAADHGDTLEVQYGGVTPDQKAADLVATFEQLVSDLEKLG